jgi:hypothetical protein
MHMPLRSVLHQSSRLSIIPKRLRYMYVAVTIRHLAEALLFVVGPIFLYQTGQNLTFTRQIFPEDSLKAGLLAVILFYAIQRGSTLFLIPWVTKLKVSKNIRFTLILGQASATLAIICLTLLSRFPWLFWIIPLLQAIWLVWYWTGYYILFAAEVKVNHIGQELGALEIITRLVTALAPLLGVLMATNYGFKGVFWLGSSLLFLSTVSLLLLPQLEIRTTWHWRDFLSTWQNSTGKKHFIGLGGHYLEIIGVSVFWPLLLFTFFNNLNLVGYLFSGATLLSLIVVYISGLSIDHHRQHTWFGSGLGQALAALWLFRILAWHFPWFVFLTEAVDKIVAAAYENIFNSLVILRLRANNAVHYAYNRQIMFAFAYLIGALIFTLILWFDWPLYLTFIIFFAGGTLSLLFVKDRHMRYGLDT